MFLDVGTSFVIALVIGLSSAILTGSKPHQYWSSFIPTPRFVRGLIRYINPTTKSRSSNRLGGVKSIESQLELLSLCQTYELTGALLGKGINPDPSSLSIRFIFELSGIDPLISTEKASQQLHAIHEGLKEIDTTVTIVYSITSNSKINPGLERTITSPLKSESLYMDLGERARIRELAKENKRKRVRILFVVTILPKNQEKEQTWLDKLLNYTFESFKIFWTTRISDSPKEQQQKLRIQLKYFYKRAKRYQQLLKRMGLNPRFLEVEEVWNILCSKCNTSCQLSKYLVLDKTGLREVWCKDIDYTKPTTSIPGDEMHPVSLLAPGITSGRNGLWVNNHYICILVMEGKPAGFFGDKDQLLYLSRIFNREEIVDVEVVTQITPISATALNAAQQFATRKHLANQQVATKHNTIDAAADIKAREAVATQQDILKGQKPYRVGVAVVISGKTPEVVEERAYLIQTLLPPPARFIREKEYATRLWLQTTGLTTQRLLAKPFERRSIYLSSEVAGVSCLVNPPLIHQSGIELIAANSGAPIFLDILKSGHFGVFGTTGSGKSSLVASISRLCQSLAIPEIKIDLPNQNGVGTFTDYTTFQGGISIDISTNCNNLLELPKSTKYSKRHTSSLQKEINRILSLLILGSNYEANQLNRTVTALIPRISQAFWRDAGIQTRIKEAQQAGLGSKEWNNYPVLSDWLNFCDTSKLSLGFKHQNIEEALNFIRIQIGYWLASPVGDCINNPSSFDTENTLTTFSLSNLEDEEEAEIWAAVIFNAISRQSTKYSYCLIHIDEASVFLKFPSFARLLSRRIATSRKGGEIIMVTTQDVDSIVETGVYGAMILQNLQTKLIGKTQKSARSSFSQYLGVPEDLIKENETFTTDLSSGCSNWLLDYGGTYIQCKYYPSYPLLALVANNPNEVEARNKFKKQYPGKFEWLTHFWRYYRERMKDGGF